LGSVANPVPYALSLQQYTPPEFYREPPPDWERRLRELSPEMPNLDRLVFRYFEPTEPDGSDRGWQHSERGQWALYAAKDIRLVDKERAAQFEKHWSELPIEKQAGIRAFVSDYQHFMWHARGLYVKPFLILQGPWGGTPAQYTAKEVAFLQASGCLDEPFPIGSFPACVFDERVVKQISLRDRLLQCSNSYEDLAQMDTPTFRQSEDAAAELHKRQTYLDTWKVMIGPSVEFMKSFIHTKEADRVLPRAPEGTANAVGQWREHWLEHGSIIGANPAGQKRVHMTVR
jgi:hypothetical protein